MMPRRICMLFGLTALLGCAAPAKPVKSAPAPPLEHASPAATPTAPPAPGQSSATPPTAEPVSEPAERQKPAGRGWTSKLAGITVRQEHPAVDELTIPVQSFDWTRPWSRHARISPADEPLECLLFVQTPRGMLAALDQLLKKVPYSRQSKWVLQGVLTRGELPPRATFEGSGEYLPTVTVVLGLDLGHPLLCWHDKGSIAAIGTTQLMETLSLPLRAAPAPNRRRTVYAESMYGWLHRSGSAQPVVVGGQQRRVTKPLGTAEHVVETVSFMAEGHPTRGAVYARELERVAEDGRLLAQSWHIENGVRAAGIGRLEWNKGRYVAVFQSPKGEERHTIPSPKGGMASSQSLPPRLAAQFGEKEAFAFRLPEYKPGIDPRKVTWTRYRRVKDLNAVEIRSGASTTVGTFWIDGRFNELFARPAKGLTVRFQRIRPDPEAVLASHRRRAIGGGGNKQRNSHIRERTRRMNKDYGK